MVEIEKRRYDQLLLFESTAYSRCPGDPCVMLIRAEEPRGGQCAAAVAW